MERLGKGRARVNDKGNELEIVIPSKKDYFIMVFMCVWLGGWAFGEVAVIWALLGRPGSTHPAFDGFFLLWLVGWTMGGALFGNALLWRIAGREVVTLSQGVLSIHKKPLAFQNKRQYSSADVKNLMS